MSDLIKNVCIFASASNDIDSKYFIAAKELGIKLAKCGYNIVYGGSDLGLMGTVTKNAFDNGSKVTGIMPEKLYNLGINEGSCSEFIITKGMRDRKSKMDELSDAVIALPGGFGTLEEVSEMLTQKQLGYNNKPIVFLNIHGYFNNLISFFDKITDEKFASKEVKNLYYIANSVDKTIFYIQNYEFKENYYLNFKIKDKNQSKV